MVSQQHYILYLTHHNKQETDIYTSLFCHPCHTCRRMPINALDGSKQECEEVQPGLLLVLPGRLLKLVLGSLHT